MSTERDLILGVVTRYCEALRNHPDMSWSAWSNLVAELPGKIMGAIDELPLILRTPETLDAPVRVTTHKVDHGALYAYIRTEIKLDGKLLQTEERVDPRNGDDPDFAHYASQAAIERLIRLACDPLRPQLAQQWHDALKQAKRLVA